MSKRIRLSIAPSEKCNTDWSKCFLCQDDKPEALKSPLNPSESSTKSGYKSLSTNIPEFFKTNEMPLPLNIRRINDGDGIENTLIRNQAKYHESCRLMFNNTKRKYRLVKVLPYGQTIVARLAKTLAGGARGGRSPSRRNLP